MFKELAIEQQRKKIFFFLCKDNFLLLSPQQMLKLQKSMFMDTHTQTHEHRNTLSNTKCHIITNTIKIELHSTTTLSLSNHSNICKIHVCVPVMQCHSYHVTTFIFFVFFIPVCLIYAEWEFSIDIYCFEMLIHMNIQLGWPISVIFYATGSGGGPWQICVSLCNYNGAMFNLILRLRYDFDAFSPYPKSRMKYGGTILASDVLISSQKKNAKCS